MTGDRGRGMGIGKTAWADIFWIWVFKGADRAYAAYMADRWEARQKRVKK